MQFLNAGYGNFVSAEKIVFIMHFNSAPIKRLVKEASNRGQLVNAAQGRKVRSVVVMENNSVIVSSLHTKTLLGRITGGPSEDEEKEAEEDTVDEEFFA